jgi:ring-1,2-phenylacetyl-CoA epoxidase subunit PaaD
VVSTVTSRSEREAAVWRALAAIPDPEIPAIGLVDLGVIGAVEAGEDGAVRVQLLPTFVGCPAIGVMQDRIVERLTELRVASQVSVELSFDPPWTSERISEHGRERLRASGFAPPGAAPAGPQLIGLEELAVMPVAECPYCGSRSTTLENPFGPTLCRAIYHCSSCRQPFEQFKRV